MYERSTYRSRSPRSRQPCKAPEIDSLTAALTMQIIICILLLLTANVTKKLGEDTYNRFKMEYQNLVESDGEGEGLSEYFSKLGNLGQDFFSSVENLLQNFLGNSQPEQPQLQEPQLESEPEPVNQKSFDYSYLSVRKEAAGILPVYLSDGKYSGMSPAAYGSTLAPVFLSHKLRTPVAGAITSAFAYREHPISEKNDFHTGIDIAASPGQGILAALPGEVEEIGEDDIYGKYITLRHATNLKTFYAHCSEIIAKEGMAVRGGERIAKVGMTGMATGPHLHFSVIVDELFTDPFWVLKDNLQLVEPI